MAPAALDVASGKTTSVTGATLEETARLRAPTGAAPCWWVIRPMTAEVVAPFPRDLLTGVVASGGHTRYRGPAEVHVCFATRRSSLSLAAGATTVPA
jgi:hypothetical protein